MSALRALPLVLLLAACDSAREGPASTLSLTTDGAAFAIDGDVGLTLRNEGPGRVETSGLYCALLETRTEAGWTRAPEGNARGCPGVVEPVPAGTELNVRIPLDGVGAGTFRFTQSVGVGGADATLATAPFEVRWLPALSSPLPPLP